jgi:hypothetical protein
VQRSGALGISWTFIFLFFYFIAVGFVSLVSKQTHRQLQNLDFVITQKVD